MKTTRTFKSGNSVAVRLPKALGIKAGTEMRILEERGKYVLEPVDPEPRRIDLSGIYGSIPGLVRQPFEHKDRAWDADRS
jgi:antitoxin VapB